MVFADLDGNGIINNSKELAPGYFLLNFSTGKTFASKYTFQMGIDNVLGHTNPQYNPEFLGDCGGQVSILVFSIKDIINN